MAEESDKTASVKIEAEVDFVANEASLDALASAVAERIESVDASPKAGREPRGRVSSDTQSSQQAIKVKIDEQSLEKDVRDAVDGTYTILINKEALRAQIMEALSKPFEIRVNADVQGQGGGQSAGFDSAPKVNRVSRGAPPEDVDKALNTRLSSGKGGGSLREAVDTLYLNLNRAFEAAGRGRFGKQGLEPGNQAEKALEIMGQFGDRFAKLMTLSSENELNIPLPTGGSLSRKEFASFVGLDPKHEAVSGVVGSTLGLTAAVSDSEISTRSADIMFSRLAKWRDSTPLQQEDERPAAGASSDQRPPPRTEKPPESVYKTPEAGQNRPEPASDEIKAALKSLRARAGDIPFQDVTETDYAAKYPVNRTRQQRTGKPLQGKELEKVELRLEELDAMARDLDDGLTDARGLGSGSGVPHVSLSDEQREARSKIFDEIGALESRLAFNDEVLRKRRQSGKPTAPKPDQDPEATARALQQLGFDKRSGNQSLIGGFQPRQINGINVDLEPLLKAARGEQGTRGEFLDRFRTEKGDIKRFVPSDEDEEGRMLAARTNNRPYRVKGIEGQVTNIRPADAFWDAVGKLYDEAIVTALRSDPEVSNLVTKSLNAGARRRQLVDPRPAQAGQGGGESGGIVSASGHGFEKGYRAAYRLLETLQEIEEVGNQLDKAQGSGKPTDKIQARYDRLLARRADLHEQALDIEPQSLEQRRILDAAQRARDAQVAKESGGKYLNEYQRGIGTDRGLNQEELERKVSKDPRRIGAATREGIEAGRLPDLDQVLDQIFVRFKGLDPDDPESYKRDTSNARRKPYAGVREIEGKPGEYETFPETSQQTLGRAFREVVGPLYTQVAQLQGAERRRGESLLGDVGRLIFGESEQYERPENAPQRVNTRDRSNVLLTLANQDANADIDRTENTRGRGRVGKTTGSRATGFHSNQGGVEVEPEFEQPATKLDAERQELMGAIAKAERERQAEIAKVKQDAQRAASKAFPGVRSFIDAGQESFAGSAPGADVEGFQKFRARSEASRMGKLSEGIGNTERLNRIAEITKTQRAANELLYSIRGITSGAGDSATQEMQRSAVNVAPVTSDVRDEALDYLRSYTAETIERRNVGDEQRPQYEYRRQINTRDTKDPLTGDETRSRFQDRGGQQAGGPPNAEAPFAGFNEGRGMPPPSDGGRGGGGGGGDSSGGRGVSGGALKVFVVNWPKNLGGRGSVSAGESDEQPEGGDEQPKTGKRRKNLPLENALGRQLADALQRINAEPDEHVFEKSAARNQLASEKIIKSATRSSAEADFLAALAAANKPGTEPKRNEFGSLPIRYPKEAPRTPEQRQVEADAAAAAANPLNVEPTRNIRSFVSPEQKALDAQRKEQEAKDRTSDQAERQRQAELRRQRRVARINDPVGFAREQDTEDLKQRELRGQLRSINRKIPRRGFGASLTDLVTSVVPGSGALERQLEAAALAEREATEISQVSKQRAQGRSTRQGLIKQIRDIQPATRALGPGVQGPVLPSGQLQGLLQNYREEVSLGKQRNIIIGESNKRFTQFYQEATKASTVLKSFGAAAAGGVVSAAAGSVQFALASTITAPLMQAVGQALHASVQNFLGNPEDVSATRLGLSQGIRGAAGQQDIGFAQLRAASGLGDEASARIGADVARSAALTAGNEAFKQQIDILKTSNAIDREGGPDAAWGSTLNGILGTALNGTTPITEQIAGVLGDISDNNKVVNDAGEVRDVGFDLNNPFEEDEHLQTYRATSAKNLGILNDALAKAGVQTIKFGNAVGFTQEQLDTQAQELADEGASRSLVEAIQRREAAILNPDNTLASGTQIKTDIVKALEEASKPTVQAILDAGADQRQARVEGRKLQLDFGISQIEPRLAMQQIKQPISSARSGIAFSKDDNPEQVARLNKELDATQKKYDQINTEIDMGVQAAKDFVTYGYELNGVMAGGLGEEAGAAFASSLDDVARISKEIRSIEVGIETKQAAFAAKQFSYQIDIAKRSLADAKGLVSGIGNNMGAVERQMYNLQRESQALSMGLSQSQINFQRAVAGFQSPGLTSEEREARKEAAKLEADYAQKQLDIQKKLFGLSGKQFNMGAARQVQDLTRQIGLLTEGRAIALDVQVDQKKIRALTKDLAAAEAESEAFYAAAVEATQDIFGDSVALVAQTGEALTTITNDVINAYRRTFAEVLAGTQNLISRLDGSAPGSRDPKDGETRSAMGNLFMDDYTHAEGWMGSVNGRTSFGKYGVAGEAGGEAVAILRDPKNLVSPMGGGGGVTNYIVNIMNPVVRKDDDLRKIVTDVKKALQTEARLVLPRNS